MDLQGIADFDGSGLGSIPYLELPEGLQEAALPGSDGSLAAPKAGRQGSGAGRAGGGPGVLRTKKAGARVPRVRRPSAAAAAAQAAATEDGGEGLVGLLGWVVLIFMIPVVYHGS
jgi:hypothetical protein